MLETSVYVSVMVLLPIVPAFLLYRLLPSTTWVSGPFKGLNIQLGGSFGGYFLVVLLVLYFVQSRPTLQPAKSYSYNVYRVEGKLGLGQDIPSLDDMSRRGFTLTLEPSDYEVSSDGSFFYDIPVRRDQNGEELFPLLKICHPAYQTPTPIRLKEIDSSHDVIYKIKCNSASKIIKISDPIELTRLPPPNKTKETPDQETGYVTTGGVIKPPLPASVLNPTGYLKRKS